MADQQKLAHEAFVSGHNGTSILEVFLVVNAVPLSYLCWKWTDFNLSSRFGQFLFDYLFLVVPCIISLTKIEWIIPLIITQAVLVTAVNIVGLRSTSNVTKKSQDFPLKSYIEPALVSPRAFLGVLTAVGILAIDFHVMPRKFAKCETYGQSMVFISKKDGYRDCGVHFHVGNCYGAKNV